MISGYKILKDTNIDDLTKKVNQAIADGWKVTGGVSAIQVDAIWFIQAVVK